MTFPIINDYVTAVRNAGNRFATLDINPVFDENGNPVFLAGNFAAVFKATVSDAEHPVAVKVFIRDLPDLARRQRMVARITEQVKASYFISLGFLPDELFVTSTIAENKGYPVVLMPWAEGDTLGAVIARVCERDRRKGLAALTRSWAAMSLDLLNRNIAHGDLKHDNVLVTPNGRLRLIDYDSFYAAPLRGLRSVLLGGASYQHPRRDIRHFDANLDHFSMLVVALSLRALTIEPGLHEIYHTGENIIFTRDDFISPHPTELVVRLLESPDALVRSWAALLVKVCRSASIAVPGIKGVLNDAQGATDAVVTGVRRSSFAFPWNQAFA